MEQEWSAKEDPDFSGSKNFPWIVLCRTTSGPCSPNVFASRMSEENALWLAEMLNTHSKRI